MSEKILPLLLRADGAMQAIRLSSTSNRAKIPEDRRQFLFSLYPYGHHQSALLTEFSKWLILNLAFLEHIDLSIFFGVCIL
ncbi:hypothetical protein, partial [Parageobacillus thermoglucosidasius]|uniref:hypothetical protein n=1 Tax=Parageobacillus thermoglucosidasius TaxID=1426 RepID=UPI001F18F427